MSKMVSEWYYAYEIGLSFDNGTLISAHPRQTWDLAFQEGVALARKFAERGIKVSVAVRDIRRKSYDFTYDVNHKLGIEESELS